MPALVRPDGRSLDMSECGFGSRQNGSPTDCRQAGLQRGASNGINRLPGAASRKNVIFDENLPLRDFRISLWHPPTGSRIRRLRRQFVAHHVRHAGQWLTPCSGANISGAHQLRGDIQQIARNRPMEAPPNWNGTIAHLHSYTYTVLMKNITLSVDENILAAVRRVAAEH